MTADGEIFAAALDRAAAPYQRAHPPTHGGALVPRDGMAAHRRHRRAGVLGLPDPLRVLGIVQSGGHPHRHERTLLEDRLRELRRILTSPEIPYTAWFANTIVIATITSVGTVFLGALAAYSFSRMRFTGRRFGLVSIVVVQMFPQMLAVVAIFLLLSTIGDYFPALGLDTRLGLIMVYLGGALGVNTFLMYGFFNTIPVSIDEAAKIDGAGHARIFFTMILRLVAPILAVVVLLVVHRIVQRLRDRQRRSSSSPRTRPSRSDSIKLVSNPRYADWPAFSAGAMHGGDPRHHRVPLRCRSASSAD